MRFRFVEAEKAFWSSTPCTSAPCAFAAEPRHRVGDRAPRSQALAPLVVELGPPPPGYRYARVANDVLLLAIGTGMVVDATTDLGRM